MQPMRKLSPRRSSGSSSSSGGGGGSSTTREFRRNLSGETTTSSANTAGTSSSSAADSNATRSRSTTPSLLARRGRTSPLPTVELPLRSPATTAELLAAPLQLQRAAPAGPGGGPRPSLQHRVAAVPPSSAIIMPPPPHYEVAPHRAASGDDATVPPPHSEVAWPACAQASAGNRRRLVKSATFAAERGAAAAAGNELVPNPSRSRSDPAAHHRAANAAATRASAAYGCSEPIDATATATATAGDNGGGASGGSHPQQLLKSATMAAADRSSTQTRSPPYSSLRGLQVCTRHQPQHPLPHLPPHQSEPPRAQKPMVQVAEQPPRHSGDSSSNQLNAQHNVGAAASLSESPPSSAVAAAAPLAAGAAERVWARRAAERGLTAAKSHSFNGVSSALRAALSNHSPPSTSPSSLSPPSAQPLSQPRLDRRGFCGADQASASTAAAAAVAHSFRDTSPSPSRCAAAPAGGPMTITRRRTSPRNAAGAVVTSSGGGIDATDGAYSQEETDVTGPQGIRRVKTLPLRGGDGGHGFLCGDSVPSPPAYPKPAHPSPRTQRNLLWLCGQPYSPPGSAAAEAAARQTSTGNITSSATAGAAGGDGSSGGNSQSHCTASAHCELKRAGLRLSPLSPFSPSSRFSASSPSSPSLPLPTSPLQLSPLVASFGAPSSSLPSSRLPLHATIPLRSHGGSPERQRLHNYAAAQACAHASSLRSDYSCPRSNLWREAHTQQLMQKQQSRHLQRQSTTHPGHASSTITSSTTSTATTSSTISGTSCPNGQPHGLNPLRHQQYYCPSSGTSSSSSTTTTAAAAARGASPRCVSPRGTHETRHSAGHARNHSAPLSMRPLGAADVVPRQRAVSPRYYMGRPLSLGGGARFETSLNSAADGAFGRRRVEGGTARMVSPVLLVAQRLEVWFEEATSAGSWAQPRGSLASAAYEAVTNACY
ncbi:hypothetical protein CLOM_g4250 [Closterium sp. NIES-68]|nr:hypothetical protein CLOM_g4250 [Closterium sp. NIES-68]GJP69262.1 hypothetical protein CLOP_g206 [Closterium sp. NIES-67]